MLSTYTNLDRLLASIELEISAALSRSPAYDMLSMFFAPARGGEVQLRECMPPQSWSVEREICQKAARTTVGYWQACAGGDRIAAEFCLVRGHCADRVHGTIRQA